MKKVIAKPLCYFILFLLTGLSANAQTKLFVGAGLWNDASKWSPIGIPSSTDIVLVPPGASITISDYATCDSIFFQAGTQGSTITINNNVMLEVNGGILFSNPTANSTQLINVGNGTLSCASLDLPNLSPGRVNRIDIANGTLTVSGNFNLSGSTSENVISINSTGTFRLGGSWVTANGTFNNGSGTIEYFGSSNQSIRSRTYNKLKLSGGTKTPSGSITCGDSLLVDSGTILNNSGSASLTLNGVFFINGTYIEGSTNGTVTLNGLVHIGPNGTFQSSVGEAFAVRGGIKNEGTFLSGSGTYTFSINNQRLEGNRMFTFSGNVAVSGVNLTVNDSVSIKGSLTGSGTYINNSYLFLGGTTYNVSNLNVSSPGNIVDYGRAGNQTLRTLTYQNLRVTGSGTKTAGGVIVINENLDVAAGVTLALNTNQLICGSTFTSSGIGTITTTNTSTTPITPDKNWSPTISYNSSSTQRIVSGNYTNLSSTNVARVLSSLGRIKISGVFSPGTGTYTRTGSTIEFNGDNTQTIPIFTYNNLASTGNGDRILPSGTIIVQGDFDAGTNSYITTGNTMVFNSATQSLSGTFNNLTLSTGGTKSAIGNITVNGILSISTGVNLNLTNQYKLNGLLSTISNSGTITTSTPTSISASPIADNKTWNGTIVFNGTEEQTLPQGTYNNLSITGTAVVSASGDITVNGVLNLAQNPVPNQGILETTINYDNYADVNNTNSTSIYNALNSYVLTMGPSATTSGSGDVTGKIRRTTIVSGITYSFGNTNTQLTFTGTSLPSQITIVSTRGNNGLHVDKSNSVKRLYQILRTGGATPTTMTIRLAYDESELNGNTEDNMVLWDHHLPYGGITPHEHGKTNQNINNNWVELSSHGVLYLASENDVAFTKYWMISNKISTDTVWIGAVPGGSWNVLSNWNSGVVPSSNSKIVIPDASTTPYDPTITNTVTVGTVEIKANGVLNGASGTLVLTGGPVINGGSGTWLNNGTFNAGTGSVIFDNSDATLSGNTTFNHLTVNTGKKLTIQGGANVNIFGTLVVNGTLDAATNPNTINYSGTSQNVINPNAVLSGYHNLVLSGTGTILPSTLDIRSNLTLNSPVSFSGNTMNFNGTSEQVVSGTTDFSFDNININNANGVNTLNNITVNGVLTFSNGKLNINNNTLTISGNVINTVTGGLKSGGSANIIVNNNINRTLSFDQTTQGVTNKINSFTNNTSSSTTTIGNILLISDVIYPTSGIIGANGNITLLSNSTKTARIAQGTGNYITGNVKVQRYIPESARRWRFVSSPVSNATLEDWRDEIFITGPGTGTSIGTINSNGFDATANNAAGVYWYNEALTSGDLNTGWTIPTNTAHVLGTGRGYRLFVRGDRSDINRITNANPNQNAVTIDVIGPVNKGDITMPVTFTNSGNINNDGWNLIGNPYPSPFNWKTFHETGRSGNSGTNYTNIEPTIWVLDPVENTYKFYNTLSSEGTIADGILSESQGFWVKATGPGASITFKESFKVDDAPTQLFKTIAGGAFKIKLMRDALNADDLLIKYMNGSTKHFDAYDVVKLSSPIIVSAWGNDSIHLALSTRPLTTQNDTIKLYVSGSIGSYTMQFTNSDKIAIQDQVLLFDNYTNNMIDLKQNNNYTFNINTNTPATFGFNRFYIVVANNNQLPVKLVSFNAQKTNNNLVQLNWATAIERNSSKFEIEHATDNRNFKTIGVVNAKGNSNVLTNYTLTHNEPDNINYYRLKQIDINSTVEYSQVVMVNFNQNEEKIEDAVKMYPIPARDLITIELNNSRTITEISIYNIDGILIDRLQPNNPKVSVNITSLATGVYVLQIEDENGEIFKRKLVKE